MTTYNKPFVLQKERFFGRFSAVFARSYCFFRKKKQKIEPGWTRKTKYSRKKRSHDEITYVRTYNKRFVHSFVRLA